MRVRPSVLCLMVAIAFCLNGFTPASAQDIEDILDKNLMDLLDVKIESASKQAEPLSEAPVPVTIITEEMIRASGVRTLHEALTLFVPGYTDVEDRNELLFAPRGIYATSQQKVLIMVNGHRINSRTYLTAMPDYGIALHNLDRVEILRGPGSSLYGNVALSGVINLITKQGRRLDKKTQFDVAAGNHGQERIRFLTGRGDGDFDFLAWGQFYRAAGELHELNGNEPHNSGKTGSILIDGVDKTPSHDVGLNYRAGKWSYFAASRQGSMIEPYGSGNSTYPYDGYRTFQGVGPGIGQASQHLGIKYNSDIGEKWRFEINPYFDTSHVTGYLAAAGNAATIIDWHDQDLGIVTQVSSDYEIGEWGKGSILLGGQFDWMELVDSLRLSVVAGDIDDVADSSAAKLMRLGSESIYSGFLQGKHRFNDRWLLNAGVRYDFKSRLTMQDYEKFSPRLAVIYLPNRNWEFKLSYSQSFVDAPYWYRYSTLALFGGSEGLGPETLSATQFQTVWKSDDKRKWNSTVLYYQLGQNLVVNKSTAAGTPADPKYINSGAIESLGLENEFGVRTGSWTTNLNFQITQALNTTDYTRFDSSFAHVPNYTANLIATYRASQDLLFNSSLQFMSEQYYQGSGGSKATVDSSILLNAGARHENLWTEGLYLDGRVYNLFDEERFQGGQSGTQIPFRQAGRWYLATLGYQF